MEKLPASEGSTRREFLRSTLLSPTAFAIASVLQSAEAADFSQLSEEQLIAIIEEPLVSAERFDKATAALHTLVEKKPVDLRIIDLDSSHFCLREAANETIYQQFAAEIIETRADRQLAACCAGE